MNITNYWADIDERLEELVNHGFVKLPSLESFNLDDLANDINAEMSGNTFAELGAKHDQFLRQLCLDQFLVPKLYDIAKNIMGYSGDISDQYHIARRVQAGNEKEMYRAHFDSHLFTMVLPIRIPESRSGGTSGDLIYFPKVRKAPKSEMANLAQKIYHKRFASKVGLEKFSKSHKQLTDNFQDYKPLLFIGNTTLHTNKQVSAGCSTYRLTLLAHFFDPSPKYGVGGMLRLLRNR